MTTLTFGDGLVQNPFSYSNTYIYTNIESSGIFFSEKSKNYPYIMKGGKSDTFELQYSVYTYQLRSRMLTTKRIKEIMDTARIPLLFNIKRRDYLVGKGFLSTYNQTGEHELLFVACVDDSRSVSSIDQVTFYVSKNLYEESHKGLHPTIKDFVGSHPGDVIVCKNILDYIGEKITLPRGGTLAEMGKYKDGVVRATLEKVYRIESEPSVAQRLKAAIAPLEEIAPQEFPI